MPVGGDTELGAEAATPERDTATVFAAGTTVQGRFRIVRFIARGGMGEVYEADDILFHERVALKTIRAGAGGPVAMERFRREIQLARRVTHPNVCRIFEVGFHEGIPFVAMELLAGETLADRLAQRGRLAPAEALPIVMQMAAGLSAAHAAGIIHRDFKSRNVLLVGERAVVTDFGLARAQSSAAGSVAESLTGDAGFVGTPGYIAPEQVVGEDATPRSDLYALGVVMFEMLTGTLPFRGDSPLATAAARLSQRPRLPADVDPRWRSVILRCLARAPEARYASAAEVVQELEGRSRRRWWPLPAAAAGVAALVLASISVRRGASPASGPPDRGAYAGGAAALLVGDCVRGRELLEQALATDANEPLARSAHALALACLGEDERARAEADAAVALAADRDLTARLVVAARHSRIAHDDQASFAALSALHTALPRDLEAGLGLLAVQRRLQRFDEARRTLSELRGLPPELAASPAIDLAEADLTGYGPDHDWRRAVALARIARQKGEAAASPATAALAMFDELNYHVRLGDRDAALALAVTLRPQLTAMGNRGFAVAVLNYTGVIMREKGDLAGAQGVLEEALQIVAEIGFREFRGLLEMNLGDVLFERGDLAGARRTHEAAVVHAQADGAGRTEAFAGARLGGVLRAQGELVAARKRLGETIALQRAARETRFLALTLASIAEVDALLGYLPLAHQELDESEQLLRQPGADDIAVRTITLARARLALHEDRPAEAERLARQLLAEEADAAATHTVLALALAARGKLDEARRTAARAVTLPADLLTHMEAQIAAAHLEGGRAGAAALADLAARAEAGQLVELGLLARLALAEVAHDQPMLAAARKEAQRRGYVLLARAPTAP